MHRSTALQAYQLRKGGTPARMAILRRIAAESVRNPNPNTRLQPGDWKGARQYRLISYAAAYGAISPGFANKTPVWYSHSGGRFRNERDASDVNARLARGWVTDADGSETAIGIVSSLSHGRFIAGYRWTSNDERVYFPDVFADQDDAARTADEHARVFAESAREDSERFDVMRLAELDADDALGVLRDCLALRHSGRRDTDDVRDAVQTVRDARSALASATAEYERG